MLEHYIAARGSVDSLPAWSVLGHVTEANTTMTIHVTSTSTSTSTCDHPVATEEDNERAGRETGIRLDVTGLGVGDASHGSTCAKDPIESVHVEVVSLKDPDLEASSAILVTPVGDCSRDTLEGVREELLAMFGE